MNRSLLVLTLFLVAASAGCATPGPGRGGEETIAEPARAIFFVYDQGLNHLAPVRSGSCPMHPSCSAYSREAFQKHGLLMGWWMTFDRLLRCGRDEIERSPRVLVRGTWKTYDPVSWNDRWWCDPPPTADPGRRFTP